VLLAGQVTPVITSPAVILYILESLGLLGSMAKMAMC
jgi:hypothetical protein